MQALQQEGV